MTGRVALGGTGVALAAYGVFLLSSYSASDLLSVAVAMAVGVVAHDALLAPLTVIVGVVAVRRLPARLRGPAAGAFVVLGTVTLSAIPVLLGQGVRADNATLLDRNYAVGWCVFAVIVAAGALLVVWLGPRRRLTEGRGG